MPYSHIWPGGENFPGTPLNLLALPLITDTHLYLRLGLIAAEVIAAFISRKDGARQ